MYQLLIADDNADSAQITKSLLDWSAYGITSVRIASSYDEALTMALESPPHLALVELKLGSRMGYELAASLRALGLKIAVCIVAEQNCPLQIRESMRCGARDYLLRPLDALEVQDFLERTITAFREETDASTPETDPVLDVPYGSLSQLTNKMIQVVRSDFRSSQSLVAIAAELDMSSKYIGRVFLKETGMKFSEYLMSYRMLEAKKRILHSREKISVIAASVGYVQ